MESNSNYFNDREILAVSELNRSAKALLESSFSQVWVQGEISNFARPGSGHWYFTLKDASAQLRCAMFRNRNQGLRFQPREGDEVIVRGRISLYEGRGDFQLIADNMQAAGAGALQQKLEELKKRLSKEGLFDADAKQVLPGAPQHIAIITSPTGAVIRDIVTVFRRRAPQIELSLFPVAVQGDQAAGQIAHALQTLNQHKNTFAQPLDAIILARGGGSIEDLWAFNEEAVARAVFASDLPVISAVGHETDFTLSDMVADLRAPTPSAAAELLAPDQSVQQQRWQGLAARMLTLVQHQIAERQQQLNYTARLLRHPQQRLDERGQRLDDLALRLQRAMSTGLHAQRARYQHSHAQLRQHLPLQRVQTEYARTQIAARRLLGAMHVQQLNAGQRLALAARTLEAVSPQQTLQRGYAIVMDKNKAVLRDAKKLAKGDIVHARLAQGEIVATVDSSKS